MNPNQSFHPFSRLEKKNKMPRISSVYPQFFYPNNFPIRGYQLSITKTCLANNTLVSLPTGLGKTLIASVVLLNYYHWFPEGKLIFLAPTRPLVLQQYKACCNLLNIKDNISIQNTNTNASTSQGNIPNSDISLLDGSVSIEKRIDKWNEARIIFCTPQVLENDLTHILGNYDNSYAFSHGNMFNSSSFASSIVCLIFDEVHHAIGNYSYLQIIKKLNLLSNDYTRIIGLSATLSKSLEGIQDLISNLRINKIEIRDDSDNRSNNDQKNISNDEYDEEEGISKYVLKKEIKVVNCIQKYSSSVDILSEIQIDLLQSELKKLYSYNLIKSYDVSMFNIFLFKDAKDLFERKLRESNSIKNDYCNFLNDTQEYDIILDNKKEIYSIFSQLEYLLELQKILSNLRSNTCNFNHLATFFNKLREKNIDLNNKLIKIEKLSNKISKFPKNYEVFYTKTEKLKDILIQHFIQKFPELDFSDDTAKIDGNKFTRVLIFVNRRDTAYSLVEDLKEVNFFKPQIFVGQGTNNNTCRLKQSEQIKILHSFNEGKDINILVSTSLGEEGLDIKEVDLVVFFDSVQSPTRFIQRIGRTGRHNFGQVFILSYKQPSGNSNYEGNYSDPDDQELDLIWGNDDKKKKNLTRELNLDGKSFDESFDRNHIFDDIFVDKKNINNPTKLISYSSNKGKDEEKYEQSREKVEYINSLLKQPNLFNFYEPNLELFNGKSVSLPAPTFIDFTSSNYISNSKNVQDDNNKYNNNHNESNNLESSNSNNLPLDTTSHNKINNIMNDNSFKKFSTIFNKTSSTTSFNLLNDDFDDDKFLEENYDSILENISNLNDDLTKDDLIPNEVAGSKLLSNLSSNKIGLINPSISNNSNENLKKNKNKFGFQIRPAPFNSINLIQKTNNDNKNFQAESPNNFFSNSDSEIEVEPKITAPVDNKSEISSTYIDDSFFQDIDINELLPTPNSSPTPKYNVDHEKNEVPSDKLKSNVELKQDNYLSNVSKRKLEFPNTEELSRCLICFSYDDALDSDSDEINYSKIVKCSGDNCNSSFHPICYGYKVYRKIDKKYFCEECYENKINSKKSVNSCYLCGHTYGLKKRSLCGEWYHPVCLVYTHELTVDTSDGVWEYDKYKRKMNKVQEKITFSQKLTESSAGNCNESDSGSNSEIENDSVNIIDYSQFRANNLKKVSKDRIPLKCKICESKGRGGVQCAYSTCLRAYHPHCCVDYCTIIEENKRSKKELLDVMLIVLNKKSKSSQKEIVYEIYCPKHIEKIKLNEDDEIIEHSLPLADELKKFKVQNIICSQYSQSSNSLVETINHSSIKEKTSTKIASPKSSKVIELFDSPEEVNTFLLTQEGIKKPMLKKLKKNSTVNSKLKDQKFKKKENLSGNESKIDKINKKISKKRKKNTFVSKFFEDESSRVYGYNSEEDEGFSDCNSFQNSDSYDEMSDKDSVLSGDFINDGSYTQQEVPNDDSLFYLQQNNKLYKETSPLNIKKQFLEAKCLLRRSKLDLNHGSNNLNNTKRNKYGFEILPDTQVEEGNIARYSSSELDDSFVVHSSENENIDDTQTSSDSEIEYIRKSTKSSNNTTNNNNSNRNKINNNSNKNNNSNNNISYKNSSCIINKFSNLDSNTSNLKFNNTNFSTSKFGSYIPSNLMNKFNSKNFNNFKYTLDSQEGISQFSHPTNNINSNFYKNNSHPTNNRSSIGNNSSNFKSYLNSNNNSSNSFTRASNYLSTNLLNESKK